MKIPRFILRRCSLTRIYQTIWINFNGVTGVRRSGTGATSESLKAGFKFIPQDITARKINRAIFHRLLHIMKAISNLTNRRLSSVFFY